MRFSTLRESNIFHVEVSVRLNDVTRINLTLFYSRGYNIVKLWFRVAYVVDLVSYNRRRRKGYGFGDAVSISPLGNDILSHIFDVSRTSCLILLAIRSGLVRYRDYGRSDEFPE